MMRGSDVMQEPLFTSFTLEYFVPKNHPSPVPLVRRPFDG